jgi:hypothetical protein
VQVTQLAKKADGTPGGFDVRWASPTEGQLTFGSTAPLTVRGAPVAIDGYPRYDNPWSHAPFDAKQITIADRWGGVTLDFANGRRTVDGHDWGHDR